MKSLTSWSVYRTKNTTGYQEAIAMMKTDLRTHSPVLSVIEDLNARTGDMKKAAMVTAMLKNAGRGLLAFELAGLQPEEIPAKTWQYDFALVGYEYEKRKQLAKELAIYYFGDAILADADAKLIALWKYWQLNNIPPPRSPKEIITKLTITKEVERGAKERKQM